ncbi:MAG: HPr family phosphocarrier protein [Christensenellaceae bacterium]|nr:HPr family phosphocarrier protein [Christensenellaceae bacterium]
MKTVTIKLSMAENVKKFVSIVNSFPYEMDLRIGRHVVDAKSILGIFSLDLSKEIALDIHSEDCGDLLKALDDFIIK